MIKANSDDLKKNWSSVAYVNTSVIANLMLKGILLASPMPIKSKVFASFDEAVRWSEENLSPQRAII